MKRRRPRRNEAEADDDDTRMPKRPNDCYCGEQPHCSHDTDARSSLELEYWKTTAKMAEIVITTGTGRLAWLEQVDREIRPVDAVLYLANRHSQERASGSDLQGAGEEAAPSPDFVAYCNGKPKPGCCGFHAEQDRDISLCECGCPSDGHAEDRYCFKHEHCTGYKAKA